MSKAEVIMDSNKVTRTPGPVLYQESGPPSLSLPAGDVPQALDDRWAIPMTDMQSINAHGSVPPHLPDEHQEVKEVDPNPAKDQEVAQLAIARSISMTLYLVGSKTVHMDHHAPNKVHGLFTPLNVGRLRSKCVITSGPAQLCQIDAQVPAARRHLRIWMSGQGHQAWPEILSLEPVRAAPRSMPQGHLLAHLSHILR